MLNCVSTGQIADKTDLPIARVIYYLASRHIVSIAWVGNIRLCAPEVIEQVRLIKQDIQKRRRR
jgi:hypothetical protein